MDDILDSPFWEYFHETISNELRLKNRSVSAPPVTLHSIMVDMAIKSLNLLGSRHVILSERRFICGEILYNIIAIGKLKVGVTLNFTAKIH